MNRMTEEELNRLAGKAFEVIDEGIMITDTEQIIVYVNAAFTSLTGYALEDVLGRSPRILSSGRHSRQFYRKMWESIRDQGSWRGEIWNKKKNGELYIEELAITTLRDEDGRVTHYVGTFKDITLRKELEAKIRYQATHDLLTGLPNRILLQERFRQATLETDRNQSLIGVMYIDLDRFKRINDSLGHHIGDKLLMQAANRLQQCLGPSDTIARIGGDELVVLLPRIADRHDCAVIANEIRNLLEKPFYIENYELFVTCSIGISLYPEHSTKLDELIKQADQALYNAKYAGRNNYQFYDHKAAEGNNTFPLEKSLREALNTSQLNVFYQPVFHAQDELPRGIEALVRWSHPDRGMISPAEFIPVAEESGLIMNIDRWVLRQACLQLAQWHERGHHHLRMGVNLSMLQFQQQDLFDIIRSALDESGIPSHSLILEITERTLMHDPESAIRTMHKIRDLGVHISLDDFGVGYSSFYYLKQLPIHTLKIDRSFIKDIAVKEKDFLIVKALISLAHNLKLNVVAEGVETRTQLALLQQEQCDYVQGFHFSKPLDVSAFEKRYIMA